MTTTTSVSGGKTSSYMALHYPTDHYIFSLVRIEDARCSPKDKSLIRYVEEKIGKEFIATAESDKTLQVLRQLEQDLGQSITWVTGNTFEQVMYEDSRHKGSLPNRRMRYCTSDMKILPIFWHCYLNLFDSVDDVIKTNIGYRADEPRRNANGDYRFVKDCNNFGERRQNWEILEGWQEPNFPLRKDGVTHLQIKSFWAKRPHYVFPKESNCVGCFNKTPKQLKEQFDLEPEKMRWFKEQEIKTGRQFGLQFSLSDIEQKDFSTGQVDLFENFTCNCTD
jgi:hypothetical protein